MPCRQQERLSSELRNLHVSARNRGLSYSVGIMAKSVGAATHAGTCPRTLRSVFVGTGLSNV